MKLAQKSKYKEEQSSITVIFEFDLTVLFSLTKKDFLLKLKKNKSDALKLFCAINQTDSLDINK